MILRSSPWRLISLCNRRPGDLYVYAIVAPAINVLMASDSLPAALLATFSRVPVAPVLRWLPLGERLAPRHSAGCVLTTTMVMMSDEG